MDIDLHKENSQKKVVTKSLRSKSTAMSLHKIKHKILKRSSKSTFRPRSRKNSIKKASLNMTRDPKLTLKDQKKHRLVLEEGGLPEGTEVYYNASGKKGLTGYIKDRGIFCSCCNTVVSPSQFEVHAGFVSRRKPYENIFLSNGKSLHQYASSLKLNGEKLAKENDDMCMFYQEVAGVKRNIQVIDSPNECALVACALCRSYDFSEDGFNDQTVIVCEQCEREYHIGCLKKDMNIDLKELPAGNWFCTADCGKLHSLLKFLVAFKPLNVKGPYLHLIKKKLKDSDADSITNLDLKWIVINGKDASEKNKLLLKEAVDIFHDCFNPIIDSVTGSDFIPSMAYGLKMGASDFSGVYSAMLTNSKVVTAGMFRIFGREFAELPIVATSQPNQGKGYFQLFLICFERLLSFLKVKKLVIPAADDVKSMWIKKFGFSKVAPKQLTEYRQTQTSMVAFQGTTLLEKEVPKFQTTFRR